MSCQKCGEEKGTIRLSLRAVGILPPHASWYPGFQFSLCDSCVSELVEIWDKLITVAPNAI